MNSLEQQLLRGEVGSAESRLQLQTNTRIDVGRWWRRVPVWLCVMADELVLLAVGRRKYFERISIADCPGTHYNHASGELVIEPAEELKLHRLKMPPSEALRILKILETKHSPLNKESC